MRCVVHPTPAKNRLVSARAILVFAGALALLHALAGAAGGQTSTTTLSFSSLADTYVDAGSTTTNFNTATELRADASPIRIIYLRFAVTGVGGRPVEHARLRLQVSGASPSGGIVHRISNDVWNEATVTYNTRPPLDGPALATLNAVTAGAIAEFNLDGAIPGDGVYDFAIESTNSSAVGYVSAAATSGQKPALVLSISQRAPTVTILQPPPGTGFFVGDPIVFQGTAADATGLDLTSAITWRSSRQGLLGSGPLVSSSLAAGNHTVTASVTDGWGVTGASQVDLTVQAPPGVNTEPLVTITAPLEGRTFTTGTPITFTASAADLEDGDLTGRITWISDRDGALGTGGSVSRTLSAGTHDVFASATDNAGLRGQRRVTVHVQTPTVIELTPIADASVDASATSSNTGTSPTLRVDSSSARVAYLRFDATGIGARQVIGATLRLQVDAATSADSDLGGTLHSITNHTWLETGITWANRPAVDGPALSSAGPVVHGQNVDFDASAAITGDGRYDFAITGDSSDEATYRSREGGPAPKLTVRVVGSVPTVTITAPPTATVYQRNDSVTFTARATDAEDGDLGASIHWSSSLDGPLGTGPAMNTGALSVGTHTITAAATDASGLRGEGHVTIRVRDPNVPPSVHITAPAEGVTVPAGTALTLTATAVDDFDGAIPSRIAWASSRDGQLGSGPSRAVVLTEGAHMLTAQAVDSDGATGAATVHVTIAPTPPVVTITAPAPGEPVIVGTSLTFRGTARDATDGDLGAALRWTSDRDGLIGTGATFTTAALHVGMHVVTAAATDAGGLVGQATETIVIRQPNTPPSVTITAPAAGSTLLAGAPILLDATATDIDDGDLAASVAWKSSRDGSLGAGGTRVVSSLTTGTHVLTATVTDADGATASATVTVTVTAASLSFVAVADTYVDASSANSKFGTASSMTVDGSPMKQAFLRFAPSGLGTLPIKSAVVRLTAGSSSAASSNAGGSLRIVSNNTWSESTTTHNTRPAIDGAVLGTQGTVAAKQVVDFDVASALHGDGTYNFGLVTSSSDDVIYQTREASSGRPQLIVTFGQNQAPAVRITAPAPGARVGEGVALTLRGAATDAEDGDLSSRIQWSSSLDGALGTGAAPVVTTLRPGAHTITAQVRDAGGLLGQATITLTVTHRPQVAIASPGSGTIVFAAALPIDFTGTASDAEDGDLASRLTWRSDLDGALGTGSRIAPATLRAGTHVITAAATDADGLTTEAHVTLRVRVPNVAPLVAFTSPAPTRPTPAGASLTLTGSATDDFDGDISGRLRWTSSLDGFIGAGATVTTSTLRTGTHVISASATDSDGQTSAVERTIVVRGPNAAPVVAIVSPAAGAVAVVGRPVALAATATDSEDGDVASSVRWSSNRDGALGTGGARIVGSLSVGTHVLTASVIDGDGAASATTFVLNVEPTTKTFPAILDTYVDSGSATKSFGTATGVITGSSTVREALLRFAVTGIAPLRVEHAVLRLTVGSGSSDGGSEGGTLRRISSSVWSETTTYNTRPTQDGAVVAMQGAVAPNQVVDFDVTTVVTGNATYNFGLTSTSSNWVKYLSRESPTGQPQLILTVTSDAPPVVQIAAPSSGTVVAAGTAIDLVATATDAESGDLSNGMRWVSSRDGALGTGGRLRAAALTAGTHTLMAVATDGAGNTASASVALVVNTAPTIAITAPLAGAVSDPGTPVTLVAAALDAEDGNLGNIVSWYSDLDGALGMGSPLVSTRLRSGTHLITVTVSDRYGASARATVSIVVNAAPTITLTSPADGATFSPGDAVSFAATARDTEDGDLAGVVRWTSDLDGTLGTGSPLVVSSLRSGTHRITASVGDAGGRTASATLTVRVNAAPTIAIDSPANAAIFTAGESIALAATANDLEDGDLHAAVAWTSSLDGALGTGSPLSLATLRPGHHVLRASVTDAGGKTASAEIALLVNVAPVLAITGPTDGATFSPGDAIALAASATDAEDGDLGAHVVWTSSLDGPLGMGSPRTVSTLRSGHHVITATVADAAGKSVGASIALVVNAAPRVAIDGPADGTTFSPGDAIPLVASASDTEDGDLGGAVHWSSDLDGPLGTGSPLVLSTLRSGRHTMTATVTDAGGKVASAAITLVVNAAPMVAIAAPSDGAVFSPGDPITLSASAHDVEDGDLAGAVHWISDLDGPLGVGAPLVVSTLRSGHHSITATVTDAGGKVATAASALVVNAAPTLAITAPSDGTTFSPGDAITLGASARDTEDGDLGSAVRWTSDLDGPLGVGAPLVVSTLRSGRHTITATVTDAGGKVASAVVTLVVNAAPAIAISAPSDGATFSPGDPITFTASASDTEDGDLGSIVAWTAGTDGPLGTGTPLVLSTLASGTHRITATVVDAGGKQASATITIHLNAAPTLAITAPAADSVSSPGDPIALTAVAADHEDGDLGAAVAWTSSLDGPLGMGSPRLVPLLHSGRHTITATVTDAGGKSASAQTTVVVNAAPSLAIALPIDGTTFAAGEPITLSASASDAEDGDLGSAVHWTSDLDGPLGLGTPLVVDNLTAGRHTLTATVMDAGGKLASASIQIAVNAAPTLAITLPADGTVVTDGDSIALVATASDAEDGDLGSVVEWTSDVDGVLGAGTPLVMHAHQPGPHHITAKVTDAGGTHVTAVLTVVVNAVPTVSVTAPTDGVTIAPGDDLTLTATAHDAEDGNLGSAITWTSDLEGPLGTGTPLVVGTLRSGTHTITATVVDTNGAQAVAHVGVVVNAPPSVTITTPADGSAVLPGQAVVLSGIASDAEDGDFLTTTQWSSNLDGSLGIGASLTIASLRPGLHTITASITDTGGKRATAQVSLLVNTPPVVNISTPAAGARFARNQLVTLAATASDAENGTLTSTIAWTSSLDGPIGMGGNVTTTTLRAGTHILRATVADAAGVQTVAQVQVIVDPTLTIAITAPVDGTYFAPDETIPLAGTATDSEEGNLSSAITWRSSLSGALGTGSSLSVGPLASGAHTITATVTTSTGRTASAAVTIVVAPLVTLQGTSSGHYNPSKLTAKTKIDASQATYLASPSNLYPVTLGGDPGIRIIGGRILGQYDRTLGWDEMHSMNNAGVAWSNEQTIVDGFRIDNVTDAFRPRPGKMFTIKNAWVTFNRDDCVENDYSSAGLIDDSLFDGCYSAFSARPSSGILAAGYDGRNNVWTIQNSLVRLQPMPDPADPSPDNLGHAQFFKWHLWDRPNDSVSPKLALHNNVFMAERAGQTADRMGIPPGKLDSCSNNVMVWLGSGPFPGPALPSCFTVTTDRSVWDNAVAAWKARHPGMAP